MKNGVSIFAAVLGGMVIGLACGVLFTPEKGADVRARISEAIKSRGIKLNRKEMENLVDDITDELETED